MKITPEIRKNREKWLQALESGKWRQGDERVLYHNRGYCCLGVWLRVDGMKPKDIGEYGNCQILFPKDRAKLGMSLLQMDKAADMNDGAGKSSDRASFPEIAAHFRKVWGMPRVVGGKK